MKTRPIRSGVFRSTVFFLTCLFLFASGGANLQAAGASDIAIIVLPFEINAEQELSYLQRDLPGLVRDKLYEKGFKVMDSEDTMQLLADQGVEYLDLSIARDMALLSGAHYAVYGSMSKVGESLSLDVRLVEAFGLKDPKALFVVREGLINLLPAVDELVEKIENELLRKEVVAEIDVENNRILDKDVVLMRLRMQKGDMYDPKMLNEEIKRLYALGYFDDVQVRVDEIAGGKRVVFVVDEKPLIKAIGVTGSDAIDEDDILEAMSVKSGSVLNFEILSQDLDKIRELYRQKGYYKADVSYEIEQTDPRQARLNIVVDEGNELYIQDIEIKGAELLDEGDLKDELALSERGFLSFITKSGILREELLDRDAAALEAYYNNRGFMDAKVGQPEVEFKDDGIYITFTVIEGPRYTVGDVSYKGDLIEDIPQLRELTELDDLSEEGDYFDRSIMRGDVQKLTDYYTDYGYAYADVGAQVDKDAEQKVMGITYVLNKGERVYIRRVTIEGNDKTRDNVIRRELRLGDGDQFSGKGVRRSQERLRKLDYFETVDLETVPTASPSEMDLRVKVKEKPTGLLSAGIGYSTADSVFVSGQVQERNLFGKGYGIGLQGTLSSRTTNYVLNFWNPRLYDTPLGVGIDSYITDKDYLEYEKETVGAKVKFGYPLGEYTRVYANYRIEKYDITDVDENASQQIQDVEGENLASVLGFAITRDTTNSRLNPNKGTLNSIELEYGGGLIGGDDNFIKGVVESNYFMPLPWDTIFHWKGSAGYVIENGSDEVPVFERFYLGGISSVRGYEGRRISPRDDDTGDRIGGDKMFFTNFEYLFNLNKDFGLMGIVFFDAGNTWDEGELDYDLFKSVGGGIRWFSPLGPIRLEYGWPLDELEDDSGNGKLEFSMGQFF